MGFDGVVSVMANFAPYHLLSYSALLGMSFYQSFTVVKTVHRALPRPAFVALQGRLFPVYFKLQTFYLFLTAATLPPYGPLSLVKDGTSAVLFTIAGISALLNFFLYGPRTRQAMIDRHGKGKLQWQLSRQLLTCFATGIRDPAAGEEVEQVSEEVMDALNKAFHKSHALSLHLNLITVGALTAYGWKLALRLKVD